MAKALLDGEMMVVVVEAERLNFESEVGSWLEFEKTEGFERGLFVRRPRRKKKILM